MRRWVISFVGLMALVGCDKIKALQGGGADAATTSVTAEDAAAATAAVTAAPTEAPTATAATDEAGAAPPATASAAATPTPTPTGGAVAVATGAAAQPIQPVQPQPVPTAQINNGAKQVGVETSSGGTALNLRNDAGTGRVVNNLGGGVTITGKSGKTLNVPTGGLPAVPR